MTFKTWIGKHAEITDDPAGDFVEDARRAIELEGTEIEDRYGVFPDSDNWNRIKRHLDDNNAIPDAITAGREAFDRYQAWREARAA